MPIILDNIAASASQMNVKANVTKSKPSYFSKSLTGQGKKSGLLNEYLLPANDASKVKMQPVECRDKKQTVETGNAKYELIPMDFYDCFSQHIDHLPAGMIPVSPDGTSDDDMRYALVQMKNMVLESKDTGTAKDRVVYPMYYILIAAKDATAKDPDGYKVKLFTEPCLNADQFTGKQFIDTDKLRDYFKMLTVYDCVMNALTVWTEHMPEVVKTDIKNNNGDHLREIYQKLNYYPISLEYYKQTYDMIEKDCPDKMDDITSVNLNMLLNRALKDLEINKSSIATFTPGTWTTPAGMPQPSPEQMAAITTTEPCCIIQSGAGSGKSSTIHNRLRFLEASGVDMSKVMVLSFTNAAANHIKALAPNVNSKTIASMIHDIYSANYNHELSTVDTVLNTLYAKRNILNDPATRQTMSRLISGLQESKKDINTGFIELADLIQESFDEVIAILNTIRQTTLELESIICYCADDKLSEPILDCDHLIMDEVQDNSIFEFVYIIRYIIRHKATLYLVGDCSQTLYEFRASNPKALNNLEMSGVFHCMKLQTNYRSNQNILDFANVSLSQIEANQYAKIQLQANNLTTRDFKEDVTVEYTQLYNRENALKEALPSMFGRARAWIQDKLDKHQQVCFLCYKRKHLTYFEDAMALLFPGKQLINIVPAKNTAQSFFTRYIYLMGEDYMHRAGNDATMEITRHIVDNIDSICRYDTQKDILKNHLEKWRNTYQIQLGGTDVRYQNGLIDHEAFRSEVFDTMIAYEIAQNAMKQHLVSMNNEKLKNADISSYDFVCSTIHSAKGLEFDNVILLYDESTKNDEESKRMYYVGLTRAKEAEYILAYNTNKGSDIESLWEMMANPAPVTAAPDQQTVDGVTVIDAVAQTQTGQTADTKTKPKAYLKGQVPKTSKEETTQPVLSVKRPARRITAPQSGRPAKHMNVQAKRPVIMTVRSMHKPVCGPITKKPGKRPGRH